MRDDFSADAKGVLGDNIIFGPIHDAQVTLHYGRYDVKMQGDSLSHNGLRTWVVISSCVNRYVAELSAECRQSMYCEAAASQIEISGTEQSVADMEPRTSNVQGAA